MSGQCFVPISSWFRVNQELLIIIIGQRAALDQQAPAAGWLWPEKPVNQGNTLKQTFFWSFLYISTR